MSTYDWFSWHRNYRTDDWFLSLTDEQKWAWVAILSWANEFDWKIPKCSIKILATNIWCNESNVSSLLVTAVTAGKIVDKDEYWYIKNGDKYRQKKAMSNAERQAKYRENKDHVTESNESNESVTDSNAPVYTIQDKTRQDKISSLQVNGQIKKKSETMAKAVDQIVRAATHERPERPKTRSEEYAERFGSILGISRYTDKTQMRENDDYIGLRGMCSTIIALTGASSREDGRCDVLERIYGEIEEARASPKTKSLIAVGIAKIKKTRDALKEQAREAKTETT